VFYPVFLDLRGRDVLVVGGGPVAERKVETLLAAEARVTVVAPEISSGLRVLESGANVRIRTRSFETGDLEGVFLVVSATDSPVVQQEVAQQARKRRIPVNTVDTPDLCDFIVPAIAQKGDITVAVSTGGKSPVLAAELRNRLARDLTEGAARSVRLLGEVREEVHARIPDPGRRKEAFQAVVNSGILEWIEESDDATALQRIRGMIEGFV